MPPRSFYNSPRPSDYIALAQAYFPSEIQAAENFCTKTGLPYVENSSHVAAYLGVSASLIRQIIHRPDYHYREFPLKKRDGTERMISTPKTYLKVVQWWILDNILKNADLPESVHGFRKDYSYVTNAKIHANSKHILNVDIKSFFDNISAAQVFNVFVELGYSESGSLALSALTTKGGRAPTGAPTSPMVANIVFRRADIELSNIAQELGLTYTRYADDLTFSGIQRIEEAALDKIAAVVKAAGFELNTRKTKFMGPGDRMDVTGVVVNEGINAPREWRNWARGFLHRVRNNPKDNYKELNRVRGIYGILRQFDPEQRKPLTKSALDTLQRLRTVDLDSK